MDTGGAEPRAAVFMDPGLRRMTEGGAGGGPALDRLRDLRGYCLVEAERKTYGSE
jgi:hypothetical protein